MTVGINNGRIDYAGNGVTNSFPVPFRFLARTELQVFNVSAAGVATELVLGTDYNVSGADQATGGNVVLTAALAAGNVLTVIRRTNVDQQTVYVPNDPFPAKTHERGLDKLTLIAQELRAAIGRAISLAPSEPGAPALTLPAAKDRAGKMLGFDALGRILTVSYSALATGLTPFLYPLLKGEKGDPGGNAMAIGLFRNAATLSIPAGTDLVQTSGHTDIGLGGARYAADASVTAGYVAAHPLSSFRSTNGRGFKLVEVEARLEYFGGRPAFGDRNSAALLAAMAHGAISFSVLGLAGEGATWVFADPWPVVDLAAIGARFDVAPDVTISHAGDIIMTFFGMMIRYVRVTRHYFRSLDNEYYSHPESTATGYHKAHYLHDEGPDYSTQLGVPANNTNIVARRAVAWPGSDTWVEDNASFPFSDARGFRIEPGAADGKFHMGFRRIVPGEDLSARPFIMNGIPQFAILIRYGAGATAGFTGVKFDLNAPPSVNLMTKDAGAPASDVALGFAQFPVATHSSYWPINARWSIRIDRWNGWSIYCENMRVYQGTVPGPVHEAGFGFYPNTAADNGGWQDLVVRRDAPRSAGIVWAQAYFGDSRSQPRDGCWPNLASDLLDGTYGIRVTKRDIYAVGGEDSGAQRARMQALGANLGQYNGVHIEVGTNDIQGNTPIGTTEANLVAMINMARVAGAKVTMSVFDLWYTQGQAGPRGQASARYDSGAALRQAILRLCADMGVKVIDDTRQPGPCLAHWVRPIGGLSYVGQGDPMWFDNIHPTIRRNVLKAYGFVRAIVGELLPKPSFVVTPAEVPTSGANWGPSPASQPIYSVSRSAWFSCRGLIVKTGLDMAADGNVIAVVPLAFRPDRTMRFPAQGSTNDGRVEVDHSTGNVTIYGLNGTTYVDVSNMQWQVAGTEW